MAARIGILLLLCLQPIIAMSQPSSSQQKSPAEIMRELRIKVLSTTASELGLHPSDEYPRVFTVLMDWPVGTNTVSVYSSLTGDSSLYTTGTFGVIGGIGHETVRTAGKEFVKIGQKYFDDAKPTKEFSYPKSDRVYFYLVGFDGVRMIDVDIKSLTSKKDKCSDLFDQAQQVIAELRKITLNKAEDKK